MEITQEKSKWRVGSWVFKTRRLAEEFLAVRNSISSWDKIPAEELQQASKRFAELCKLGTKK